MLTPAAFSALNLACAVHARDRLNAHAVVFSELTLAGYPPEDLLFRGDFISHIKQALNDIASLIQGIDVVVGFPEASGKLLYNSAAVLRNGSVLCIYRKHILPNYGVFDEMRYFSPGDQVCVFELSGISVGITLCEDVWKPGVVELTQTAGAKLLRYVQNYL